MNELEDLRSQASCMQLPLTGAMSTRQVLMLCIFKCKAVMGERAYLKAQAQTASRCLTLGLLHLILVLLARVHLTPLGRW